MHIFQRSFLFCLLALGTCFAHADFIDDFLEIESGWIPHLYSNEIGMPARINFAVETNGITGISVTVHHEGGWGYVEEAHPGQVLNDAYFSRDAYEISSPSNSIAVAFRWWYPSKESPNYRRYGWFVVERRATEIAVLGCLMSDTEGDLMIPNDLPTNPAETEDPEVKNWKWIQVGDGMRLAGIPENTQGSVVVPATIKGIPVVEIGDTAFCVCRQITSVTLPKTICRIGNEAFAYCDVLTLCDIPAAVTNIGSSAFYRCLALQEVVLPQGLRTLGEHAFASCEAITSLVCSCSISEIGNESFRNCQSLLSASLPATLVRIGDHAFAGCRSLSKCDIPRSVVNVGVAAFSDCAFQSVVLPYGVTLGLDAFPEDCAISYRYPWAYARELTVATNVISNTVLNLACDAFDNKEIETLLIPDSVTNIAPFACSGLPKLREIVVGNGLVTCGDDAFSYCICLSNVVIRDGCQVIGDRMFAECPSLTSISIPPSVRKIGSRAFAGCTALKAVNVPACVEIADGAFPSGCNVSLVGPSLMVTGNDHWEYWDGDSDGSRLLRLIDSAQWARANRVNVWMDDSTDEYNDIKLLSYTGISASRYVLDKDGTLNAYFMKPEFKIAALVPSVGQMIVRVAPAKGASIARSINADMVGVRVSESMEDMLIGNITEYRDGAGISVDDSDYEREGLLKIDLSGVIDGSGSRFFEFSFAP